MDRKDFGIIQYILISLLVSVVVFVAGLTLLNEGGYFDNSSGAMVGTVGSELSSSIDNSQIVNIVEKVNPAVVSVVISQEVPNFRQLGPFQIQLPGDGGERQIGGGSGFFVSEDGLVMTNKHVVSNQDADYSIVTSDGEEFEARVLDRDPFNDLAVLEVVDGGNFPYLDFADSNELKLGQSVIAIGNALGEFSNSVSVGVVSGLSRSIVAGDMFGQSELLDKVIQTDAAINPGNSGGPLLNLSGGVVGVNVAVARGSENIAFALPGNLAFQVYESVKEYGEIVRPWLGVRYVEITPELARREELPVENGAYIIGGGEIGQPAVVPDSPAARAGLREGDIIMEIGGEKLEGRGALSREIQKHTAGDEIEIKYLRNGEKESLNVELERAPADL